MKIKFTNLTGSRAPRPASRMSSAFTLVELLIVIAVIATIAALLMPAFSAVENHALIQRAQSERDQLETAIERYHGKFGFYPPGNAAAMPPNLSPALTNQLYYELDGTITTNSGTSFVTLDNSSPLNSTTPIMNTFGVSGFMNCTKGSGDDAVVAQTFLPALKSGQIATNTGGNGIFLIVTAVNSGVAYKPLPGYSTANGNNANPWRYLCPGVYNPNSYDLWLQIIVAGKTNLICNWKDQPTLNSPLP